VLDAACANSRRTQDMTKPDIAVRQATVADLDLIVPLFDG